MNWKTVAPTVAGLLLLLGSPLAAAEAAAEAEAIPVPDSIVTRNVPPIPHQQVAGLLPYENIRTASFQDWHPRERRMLVGTRFGETVQLHEVGFPLGARRQLTFYGEPVTGGGYRPGHPGQLVFGLNEAGAENYQLYLLDRAAGRARRFTDGTHRYESPVWSNDGKLLAYASNARNGRDFDVYVIDPEKPESERRVAQVAGAWSPEDWSPDDRRLLLSQYVSANESYLHRLDLATGELHRITPEPGEGEETVFYGGGLWSADGRSIYTATDRGGEFRRLVRIGLDGETTVLTADIPWDVAGFDLSDDGKLLAFFVNDDGIGKLHFLDTATGRRVASPEIPPGVASGPRFRPGSHEVGFHVSWARAPSDAYSYDPQTGRLERWTASEVGGLDPETFAVPELVRFPTFDQVAGARRQIPAFVYRPDPRRFPGKRPVYVKIHGGPEGQARPGFLGSENYLMNELGVAMIVPNVRGSAGYGKSYLKLDNGRLREDSVKDIGALLDWLATQPDLDASRVMVSGGSYGGYMVLASLTHYSERLRCGYDSVGISNFVTFLENTQDYRRDLRRAEYGDERDPEMRKFLEGIAPSRNVERIKVPLLVAQGANDPRVPLSESDQIVAALESQAVPVWYVVAKNEGHGFRKKTNSDYLRAVLFEFTDRCLLSPGEPGTLGGRQESTR
jgi:dipeptidyl aminopeptidase/acylaminoacyl peptidase